MTYEQFDEAYDSDYSLFQAHSDYILENYDPSDGIVICNGDSLIVAAENGYLYEEFRESYIDAHYKVGC